jgi:hypothetical protein
MAFNILRCSRCGRFKGKNFFWGAYIDRVFVFLPLAAALAISPLIWPQLMRVQAIGMGAIISMALIALCRKFVVPRLFPKWLCSECEKRGT